MRTIVLFVVLLGLALPAARGQLAFPADRGESRETARLREALLAARPELRDLDVVLITLDAVRPEEFGFHGARAGGKSPTPAFDRLAGEAVVFERAFAPSPHRLTALHGILASQYPTVLRGLAGAGRAPTAAAIFADRGFKSWGFFGRELLALSREDLGPDVDQLDLATRVWERGNPEKLVPLVTRIHEARAADQPLFGWVHLPVTYPPAHHHPGFDSDGTREGHHAAAVRYADRIVADLLDALSAKGALDRTIVAIVGVHGWTDLSAGRDFRQDALTPAALAVPMLVRVPGLAPSRHEGVVETLDVVPTLMALTGRPVPPTAQGRAVLAPFSPREESGGERLAFAESLPLPGDVVARPLRRVTDGRAALVLPVAEGDADPGLADAIATFRIWNEACVRAWKTDLLTRPEITPAAMRLARAVFLDAQDDPRARDAARVLLDGTDVEALESALRILHRRGTAEDVAAVAPLEPHPQPGVRALAGAFLARHGAAGAGLDHAIAGLSADLPDDTRAALVTALAAIGGERAFAAIRAMDVGGADDALIATRVLALARSGDAGAADEAVRLLLDPQATYPRRPFVEMLVGTRGEEAGALLGIFLEHGQGDRDAVLAALDAVERLDVRAAQNGVARALAHPDRSVRTRARAVLDRFGSLAFHPVLIELARRGGDEFVAAVNAFLATPVLIGSPVLPGVWLDDDPALGREVMRLLVNAPSSRVSRCALAFRIPPETVVDPSEFWFQISLNSTTSYLRTESIDLRDGVWIWTGTIPEGAVDIGNNAITLRVGVTGRTVDTSAVAFLLMPDEATLEPELALHVAGDRTVSMAGRGRGLLDGGAKRLWIEVVREGRTENPGSLVLEENGAALATIELAVDTSVSTRDLEPDRRPDLDGELRLVARFGATPPRSLRALVFTERTTPAGR